MLASRPTAVVLTGTQLTLNEILSVARDGAEVEFTPDPKVRNRIQECFHHMMEDIEQGIPVYGCNSDYGAWASVVIIQARRANV
jgi:phenylalanine ammonia-lyase